MGDMDKLTRDDLYTLEAYEQHRTEFRARVMEHKQHRRLPLGDNVTLIFEDRLTMHYQVQEMLRAEKIFTAEGIAEELGTYNPLIPDGSNWKATMMIEYPDPAERQAALEQLLGIEDRVWVEAGDAQRVYAIADEDLERSTDVKTSSVHFLRFELPADAVAALKNGAPLRFGIDHAQYECVQAVCAAKCESLIADLA
jgi:hypothetical protein